MPLFVCTACGCVDNTAFTNFWTRGVDYRAERPSRTVLPALCSACDPEIGAWHGEFPRRQWSDPFWKGEAFVTHASFGMGPAPPADC